MSIKSLYESSKQRLNGNVPLKPPFSTIEDWITENLGVSPLNVTYDPKFLRLNIIFKESKELDRFTSETRRKYKTVSQSRTEYLNILNNYPEYANEQLYLNISFFDRLALDYVGVISDISEFQEALAIDSLWKIYKRSQRSCVFFFKNQEQADHYNEPQQKKYLKDEYFAFLKKRDEFDLLTRKDIFVFVDTQENFITNYQGSMQFYMKDH